MRLLVCGDRHWYDYILVRDEIEAFRLNVDQIECVIEGGAHGADFCGKMAAIELGIPVEEYPADWEHDGKRGGPIRNARMLAEGQPDFIIAFHDDIENSKGTKNMLNLAKKAGIQFVVVHHDAPWDPDITVHEPPKKTVPPFTPYQPLTPKTYPRTPATTPGTPYPYVGPWVPYRNPADKRWGDPNAGDGIPPRYYANGHTSPAVSKAAEKYGKMLSKRTP
jgi:YspA, cpYpsA-related SLOG family